MGKNRTNVGTDEIKVVPRSEKLSFSIGLAGTNMIYGFISLYLMIYLTDVFGISGLAAGTLLMVTRLIDAFCDPLIGIMCDNTMGKLIYAYIAYIGFSLTYSIDDVPKWSLTTVMTPNSQERTSIISFAKIFGAASNILPALVAIPLINLFGKGNDSRGYFYTALMFGIFSCLGSLLIFFKVKERTEYKEEKKPKLSESLKTLFMNKPLIMLFLSSFVVLASSQIRQALTMYYVTYNLGNKNLVPLASAIAAIPMLIGVALTPKLSRAFGKKTTFIAANIFGALAGFLFYFTGYHNLVLVFIMLGLSCIPNGITLVLIAAMSADTIDYAHAKFGVRCEGVIFSTSTFNSKITNAIGSGIVGAFLTFIGYVPNAHQTVACLNHMHELMTVIPSVLFLLGVIPLFFYELTEKRLKEIHESQNESNETVKEAAEIK